MKTFPVCGCRLTGVGRAKLTTMYPWLLAFVKFARREVFLPSRELHDLWLGSNELCLAGSIPTPLGFRVGFRGMP